MIAVKNKKKITCSEKAFRVIYKKEGFKKVSEKESKQEKNPEETEGEDADNNDGG